MRRRWKRWRWGQLRHILILKDDSSFLSPRSTSFGSAAFKSNADEEFNRRLLSKAAMAADLKGETTRSNVIDVDSSLPKSYNKSTATNCGDEASKKHATEPQPQPQPPILVWMRDGADWGWKWRSTLSVQLCRVWRRIKTKNWVTKGIKWRRSRAATKNTELSPISISEIWDLKSETQTQRTAACVLESCAIEVS